MRILATLAFLAGCASARSITILSASEAGVMLSFPTGVSPAAVLDRATRACAVYGRRAAPAIPPSETRERESVATFYCLP